ncbi:TlpA family protein disulfide reductase [Sphingobacterium siyangense]|uniref:TlpA family protein disulfide reductase n=1 Tax=Sphingobacterium siyangense TaxID=459529 RepID=UPI0013150E48|nr:TlpA disulfide reductase family protein [Sphingobacterium siyangense]
MRKKIRQGKTYFKGTSILLKKRCTISAQKLLKKADSSGSLRVLFEDRSTLRRISVASSSGMLRLLFDCASGRSRSVLEALPKPSRRAPEHVSTMSRRSLEAEPKASRREEKVSPSSDFCLTNFAPTSAFHAIGIEFSSGSHRVTPIKTRCRLDENPMKCKNSAGNNLVMVDYSLAQETHKLDYSATLGSPLLSPCYTQGQLNDCTRPTQQKQAFQQVGNARLTYEVESERSVLWFFKSICKALVLRANTLLGSIGLVVQQALKCFLFVEDYKRAHRMVLSCLFLCLVSMFSLSAQTPRKDSGADGLSEIQALGIGDTIPQSLWNLQMPVYNDSKGRSTISLSDYQDNKLIIVDFWATWCTNCIESFPKLDQLKATFKSDFDVLLVNCKRTRDDQARIDRVLKKYKDNYQLNVQFPYIIGDTIFNALFPHRGIPHVVWIGNDRVVKAITYTTELQEDNVRQILDGKKANFYIKDDFKYKVQDSLSTDTLKLFSSYLSKRREGIREMGVQIKEKGDEKEFTFLNSSVTMRIYEYLSETGHRIERNLWVFDTNVANEIRRTLKTPQRYTDEYCYFLRYPKDRIDFDPYRKMIHDIQDNFGVRWKIRKEVIDVWRIDSTPKVRKLKTKGHIPLEAIDASNNKKFIQNVPLRNSLHVLSWLLNKPVLLGDIDDINVDFDLPADLLTYTDTQLIQLLERLGAKITVAPQEVEYVYFSADKGI